VRVLLDECLPKRLKRELVGYEVRTAPEMGWASKRNGELLARRSATSRSSSRLIAICRTSKTFRRSTWRSWCS